MDNTTDYYAILEVSEDATLADIKSAFRRKAKRLHPDITGENTQEAMQALLLAYEVLTNRARRRDYDRKRQRNSWNYHAWLKEHSDDPEYKAKRILFEIFNCDEEEAVRFYRECGGINFRLKRFLDREDWMDAGFMLAEGLFRLGFYEDAFELLVEVVAEERCRPYFGHFAIDVEGLLKKIVRLHLRGAVDEETWVGALRIMVGLGFSAREEAWYLKCIAEALCRDGDLSGALEAFYAARERDAAVTLSKKGAAALGI
jgi:hypothetical protein